jgi:hypothetical protein
VKPAVLWRQCVIGPTGASPSESVCVYDHGVIKYVQYCIPLGQASASANEESKGTVNAVPHTIRLEKVLLRKECGHFSVRVAGTILQ